jgi:hypothetical protein
MAADCKSAAPWSYGGSNPPLCTICFVIVPTNLRLALALIAYAALGFLAWRTMEPDKIRLVTFAILALLAFRTVTHAARMKREAREAEESGSGLEQSADKG